LFKRLNIILKLKGDKCIYKHEKTTEITEKLKRLRDKEEEKYLKKRKLVIKIINFKNNNQSVNMFNPNYQQLLQQQSYLLNLRQSDSQNYQEYVQQYQKQIQIQQQLFSYQQEYQKHNHLYQENFNKLQNLNKKEEKNSIEKKEDNEKEKEEEKVEENKNIKEHNLNK
jgi:hypothetical protein